MSASIPCTAEAAPLIQALLFDPTTPFFKHATQPPQSDYYFAKYATQPPNQITQFYVREDHLTFQIVSRARQNFEVLPAFPAEILKYGTHN